MKTITVSVDDTIYRRARMKAADRHTSVSTLVRQFLNELAGDEGNRELLKREEAELRASIRSFRASDRLPRDNLHGRVPMRRDG
ncbi:hypothetical protein [Inquilinus limosus]|uniref:Uncharacterized protein n=1 Tax=Inquilinus limosus TaxID=171674 RepID=A0A211YW50_9PROT|nr:hypothetical protein [Inquilinus limosus]OWJ57077.1 hypothetical protein BWR60_34405 [Inquilinus limosus]